jgi:hypothetical protein
LVGVVNQSHPAAPMVLQVISSAACGPPPGNGLLLQSEGRLSGGGALGDGRLVTLAGVPSEPMLPYQQLPLLFGLTMIPPWSH